MNGLMKLASKICSPGTPLKFDASINELANLAKQVGDPAGSRWGQPPSQQLVGSERPWWGARAGGPRSRWAQLTAGVQQRPPVGRVPGPGGTGWAASAGCDPWLLGSPPVAPAWALLPSWLPSGALPPCLSPPAWGLCDAPALAITLPPAACAGTPGTHGACGGAWRAVAQRGGQCA